MEVWEEALRDAVQAIRDGASPWDFADQAIEDLSEHHFKEGFKEAYAGAGAGDWPDQRTKVLRMARCAGTIAGLFAEWKTGDPAKSKITLTQLLAAMAVVRPGCPDAIPIMSPGGDGPIRYRGIPCRRATPDGPAKALFEKVVADVRTYFGWP